MWVKTDSYRLWYDMRGAGRPVVFLHGWTMDHRDEALEYEPIFAEREGYSRIYLDLPGMGQSPAPEWIDRQEHMLEVVLDFIERILGQRRYLLSGTSAGAYLALGVVHRRREGIDGLLLKAPLVMPDDDKRHLPAFHPLIVDAQAMAALEPADAADLKEALVQRSDYLAAFRNKLKSRVQPAEKLADHGRLGAIRRDPKRYGFAFDVRELALPFEAPTLLICGRQDTVVGYRDILPMLEYFPRATLAILDRADHGMPIDRPGLFRSLVGDWLDRVEEMRAGLNIADNAYAGPQ